MTDTTPIEVKVFYATRDLWRISLKHFLSFASVFYLFLLLSVFGLFLSVLFLNRNLYMSHIVMIIVSALIFTLLYGLVLSYISVSSFKRRYEGEWRYIFTPSTMQVITNNSEGSLDWALVSRAKETKNYFDIVTKIDAVYSLPKRCFDGVDHIDQFRELIGSRPSEIEVDISAS